MEISLSLLKSVVLAGCTCAVAKSRYEKPTHPTRLIYKILKVECLCIFLVCCHRSDLLISFFIVIT
jgi:hypothetical protein